MMYCVGVLRFSFLGAARQRTNGANWLFYSVFATERTRSTSTAFIPRYNFAENAASYSACVNIWIGKVTNMHILAFSPWPLTILFPVEMLQLSRGNILKTMVYGGLSNLYTSSLS